MRPPGGTGLGAPTCVCSLATMSFRAFMTASSFPETMMERPWSLARDSSRWAPVLCMISRQIFACSPSPNWFMSLYFLSSRGTWNTCSEKARKGRFHDRGEREERLSIQAPNDQVSPSPKCQPSPRAALRPREQRGGLQKGRRSQEASPSETANGT